MKLYLTTPGEIQSGYWNQNQLTIFTVCMDGEREEELLYLLVMILTTILTTENGIKKADIFSDGPSSQFKNQYILSYLPSAYKRHHLDSLNWNFFATSHGKGAVDGVGGDGEKKCMAGNS